MDRLAGLPGDGVLPLQLGVYRVLARLGQGGMGTVFQAWHTRLKRMVALKTVRAEYVNHAAAAARFQREMEAVGKLDHPNLIRATDAGEASGVHFLVMDFVEGIDAHQVSHRHGPLALADACEIVRQAAVGLEHAHRHGLVHRDIKPSNLMITAAGQVKVLDLGLALLHAVPDEAGELTGSNQWMGTADFMAPEQAQDAHRVDIRADVYSLGCTLYKLLSGQTPFSGSRYSTPFKKMEAHAREPVPPLRDWRPEVPAELAAVLDRMLAKAPVDRFATPGEVAVALAPFAAGSDLPRLVPQETPGQAAPGAETGSFGPPTPAAPQASPPSPTPSRPAPRPRRRWWAAAVLVGLGLAIGLLAWWRFHPPNPPAPPSQELTARPVKRPAPPKRKLLRGRWHNLLDRQPERLFWPPKAFPPQFDAQQERLSVRCDSPGYLRLGTVPPGVRYRVLVGFKDLQWTTGVRPRGKIGLVFGYQGAPGGPVFQELFLKPLPAGKGRFSLCRSTGRIQTLRDGQKDPVSLEQLGENLPPLGDQEHLLEVEVGKIGPLISVQWNNKGLSSLVQNGNPPSPRAYHGDLGIVIDKCSAEITRVRILIDKE